MMKPFFAVWPLFLGKLEVEDKLLIPFRLTLFTQKMILIQLYDVKKATT